MHDDEGAWEGAREERGGNPAAAVPPDVAASMRQFIEAMTTPQSDLEQQISNDVSRWAARHERLPIPLFSNHCLAGGSLNTSNNSQNSTPDWRPDIGDSASSGSRRDSSDAASSASSSTSSSGRGSEEGTSAAWRLCTWLQRAGWPAQHCASIRTGGSSGGGGGWKVCSGHEFLVVHPSHCRAKVGAQGKGDTAAAILSTCSSGGNEDTANAIVIDPEFNTQFALASPTHRYAVLLALLPRVFVGSYERLQQLVEWVCREMQLSFTANGSGLPSWRSLAHVLDKWRLREDTAASTGEQALQPPPPPQLTEAQLHLVWGEAGSPQPSPEPEQPPRQQGHPCAADSSPTTATAMAFSAEQQNAMRQLLLHQALQSAQPAQTLTASSSASSMDVVSAAPQSCGALPTSARSLLTRELSGAASTQDQEQERAPKQATWQRQQQGPAAAILSIMAHSADGS